MRRRLANAAWGLVGLVAFLAILELVPRAGIVDEKYLPPASDILSAVKDEASRHEFWVALGDTLKAWAVGLAIAFAAGLALGILIGSIAPLRAFTSSTIEFLRPIPSVALIPIAVLLYGTTLESSLILIVYAAFWQVLIQVLAGVADVDPVARETARSYGVTGFAYVRKILWPSALPYVMTGLRLAAAVSLILAITAELVIGSPGLGKEIALAQTGGAVDTMYALVLITGLIGVVVNIGVRVVERRALAWHPSVRGETPA